MKNYSITSHSLDETIRLGEAIGQACRGGEVFEFLSDLGGGKTTFVRGLVAGIGSSDEVSSPSFTINNSYEGGRLRVEHFDFYRLDTPGLLAAELQEDIFSDDVVVAVEWGDVVGDVLPEERIVVTIRLQKDDSRKIDIAYPEILSHILEHLS